MDTGITTVIHTYGYLYLSNLAMVIVFAPFCAVIIGLLFRRHTTLLNWTTTFFSLGSLVASMLAVPEIGNQAVVIRIISFFNLYLDALSIYFVLLVNMVALFASISTAQFLRSDAKRNPFHNPWHFHLFFNFFHMTMLLVPLVDNLVTLWIAVELTTVFSTMLVRYRRDRLSLEAAWKFIMITTTGIIFALLGTLFMANAIPQTILEKAQVQIPPVDMMSWAVLADKGIAEQLNKDFVRLSFLLILLGYGTKAGLAPMHSWLPDGHGQAPSPVSALLSGVMLKSALYAILRFYTITNLCLGSDRDFTYYLLLVTGIFSLLLATPFILKRNRFKRVLAYHSLEHMGIITFGIAIGTPVALFGALLHAMNHALTKALMFLVYGSIQYEYQERTGDAHTDDDGEEQIRGVLKAMPLSGTILALGGLALVGSPPFNIFMSEMMILWAAVKEIWTKNSLKFDDQLLWIGLVFFVITVTIIFAGLVGHLARLLLGPAPIPPVELAPRRWRVLGAFIFLLLVILLFGIWVPDWPINFPSLLWRSVLIVQNGVLDVLLTGLK
jgi:hydrogenase-4 component F